MRSPKTKEISIRLDDAFVLAVAAKVAAQENVVFGGDEHAVLAAMRRAHPSAGSTNEELGRWLSQMNDTQIQGVVSNTKGVLHEMRFVELENADGDTVYAAQFEATNHPGFDVAFSDSASGADWSAQLKATESEAYIRDWLERHPDGEILVTTEIAERIGIDSSGVSNSELTVEVEQFVGSLISADQRDEMWDYVPGLTAISIAMVIYELHRRLRLGEIRRDQFAWMVAKASGQSSARVVVITALLSVPIVNVVTVIALIANALSSSGLLDAVNHKLDDLNARLSDRMKIEEAAVAFKQAIFVEGLMLKSAMSTAREDLEIEEKCRDENFRKLYTEARARIEKRWESAGLIKPSDDPVVEYIDPECCVPNCIDDTFIAHSVNEKIEVLRTERKQRLSEAREFLKDERLKPHFYKWLEKKFGSEAAIKLNRAISSL